MIAVKLMGGLGNQMFQYAIGRRLALHKNAELYLDLSFLNLRENVDYTLRKYELSRFKISAITKDVFFKDDFISKAIHKLKRIKYLVERNELFDPTILSEKRNVYLSGFWQSEKYFADIRQTLLEDFALQSSLSKDNMLLSQQIASVNSVSIHIRRGDYISNKNALSKHGVLGLDYYKNALNLIRSRVPNPVFYIFSDDINWIKQNLHIEESHYIIEHNKAEDSYLDMILMSTCKHNIIANSSFSWWGAWLNDYSEKMVIGPKNWFSDSTIDTSDIIPESWIKM